MNAKEFVRDYALHSYTFTGEKEDYFVARLIHKYMTGKRVLDLGCGPVVPITKVFYQNAEEVIAVDLLKENLDFVRNHYPELDEIVKRAAKYKHRYLSKKDSNPRVKLVKGDITKRLDIGKFDSVMNLGCFGALDTNEQFFAAVKNAHDYLKKGGTLLMVNWVGKNKRPFHFNGNVNEPDVYVPSMREAGFQIKEMHTTSAILCPETKAMGYNKIIWAVAKK